MIPAPSRIPTRATTVATTRRDETPSNIKPSDPYDDIIDLDWLGVQGAAARLDEPTRPLTPSHIYIFPIQVIKTPTPPRRTRHHTPLVDRFHRPLAGELVATPRKHLGERRERARRRWASAWSRRGQNSFVRSFERKKERKETPRDQAAVSRPVPWCRAWRRDLASRGADEKAGRPTGRFAPRRSFRQNDSVRVTEAGRPTIDIKPQHRNTRIITRP